MLMPIVYPMDRLNPVWVRLKQHYEARLQALRVQNDRPMDEGKRNIQIGRIQEVLALLDLDKEESTATSE